MPIFLFNYYKPIVSEKIFSDVNITESIKNDTNSNKKYRICSDIFFFMLEPFLIIISKWQFDESTTKEFLEHETTQIKS